MKVYVLVCDWAWDFQPDMEVLVFKNRETAIRKMNEFAKSFKDNEGNMRKLNAEDHGETYCSFYHDGCWQENHIAWTIYEKELIRL